MLGQCVSAQRCTELAAAARRDHRPWLQFEPETLAAAYNQQPFLLRHRLAEHPLLALPALAALCRRLPRSQVAFRAGRVPGDTDFDASFVRYRDGLTLIEAMLGEVALHTAPLDPGITWYSTYVFISARDAVTPYRMDRAAPTAGGRRLSRIRPFLDVIRSTTMAPSRPPVSAARRRYGLSLSLGLLGLGLRSPAIATPAPPALAPPDQGAKYQVLHHFHAGARLGGTVPAGVIQGVDGRLYGTTVTGGPHEQGTVYTFSDSEGFATLYGFEDEAGGAMAALLQGPDGALYGTTYGEFFSSTLRGTVYRVDLDGRYTRLHDFTGGDGDGALPQASLILASDGRFYGTTSAGGDWGQGTVFRMTSQGRVDTLWSLNGQSEGALPACRLLQADDGHLYGTTSTAGRRGGGTIFRLTLDGQFTLMHAFRENSGWRPTAGLIQATDGDLYGITAAGGYQPSNGSLFKITLEGEFTVLQHLRSKRGPIGCRSTAGLIQGRDGGFYGTTTMGSRNDTGSAFRMLGDELQALHRYQDTPGYQDRSALLEASDGALYGTSTQDGLYGRGTLYRLSTR